MTPEDEGNISLRNVGNHSFNDATSLNEGLNPQKRFYEYLQVVHKIGFIGIFPEFARLSILQRQRKGENEYVAWMD